MLYHLGFYFRFPDNKAEHFFMYFLTIWISDLIYRGSLYILDMSPIICFANIFSHSVT